MALTLTPPGPNSAAQDLVSAGDSQLARVISVPRQIHEYKTSEDAGWWK
jgi:hypothetical protein